MDNTRETLNPQVKDLQTEGSWVPATPVKAGLAELQPICTDNQENQPCQANWLEAERFSEGNHVGRSSWLELDRFSTGFSQETQAHGAVACCSTNSIDIKWGFESWEEAEATKSSLYSNNVDIYNKFLMDTAKKWSNIPFADLLALAEAATATSAHENATAEANVGVRSSSFGSIHNSHIEDGRSISSRPPFDLNLRPKTIRDAVLGKSISSQFVPVTPDQTKRVDKKQVSDMPNLDVEKRKNVATDEKDNEVATKRVEVNELYHEKEQSQMPTDQSCGAVCTELQENHNSDNGGNQGMDLSKTAQQKPRRKRHRPKVVIEGQPKRTRKPRTPKPAGPEGTPTGKRKYVRKNGLKKTPTTPPAEETGRTTEPRTVGSNANSCRRSLNFDFESQLRDESSSCRPHSNFDSESQSQNFCTRVRSTVHLEHGMEVGVEKTQAGITCNLTHSINLVPEGYLSVPAKQAPSPSTPSKFDPLHDKLMDDAAPSPNDSNCSSSACLTEGKRARGLKRERSSSIDEAELCSVNAIDIHYKSFQAYLATLPVHEYNGRIPGMHFPEIYKKKRTEKGHNSATSGTLLNPVRRTMAYPLKDTHADPFMLETNGGYSAAQFSASSAQTKIAADNAPQDKDTFQCMLPNTERSKKKRTKGPTRVRDLASLIAMVKRIKWLASHTKEATSGVMQEFEISQPPHTCMEALSADTHATMATKKRTKRKSLIGSVPPNIHNHHKFFNKSIGSSMGIICKDIFSIDALVERFRHLDINTECNLVAYLEQNALIPYNTRYQEQNALVLYQRDGTVVRFEGSSVKKRRPRPKVELDDETNRVWKLLLQDINSNGIDGTDEDKATWWEEERRVFRGRADSFIARMHLVQGDRRFSKWKGSVLDSVVGVFLTQNVSDHLSSSAFMSLAARFPLKSKSTHGPAHKERTSILVKEPEVCVPDPNDTIGWHEEKSSQPASDQSSMTAQDAEDNEEKEVVDTNESFGSSTDGNGSKDYSTCKLLDLSKNDLDMYHESVVNRSVAQITGTVASCMGDHRELDDVNSSQYSVNSLESSIAQTAERIGSCSQSNSEAELIVGSKLNSFGGSASFVELLRMAGTTMLRRVYNQENGNVRTSRKVGHNQLESMACDSQKQDKDRFEGPRAYLGHVIPSSNYQLHKVPEVECFDMLGDESRYCGIPKQDKEKCASQQSGLSAQSVSKDTVQNITTVSPQEAPKSSSENNHPCNNLQAEVNKIFQSQRTPEDPTNNLKSQTQENNCKVQSGHVPNFSGDTLDVAESTSITDNSRKNEHKAVESNLNDHTYLLHKTLNGTNVDTSKAKRVRSGKEKQNAVDWDSLRKQAQANGKKRERTANTMDSLDWEAVRCADVNEIAYTIRERGMNNVLAERIKDFLNRLVREHGSSDLEWLRDVPPDKAKEYLLSVRGLGLKSVECVRLLTLHHLAFPVDTNVGRIAVRLGWVPLQPLPESLQLHLLELYPVLESIQKYLWPRLCKLDQRTLYELHYQMITFGKVFCTKSKPNCNACPMRGECRHFASAFASARLALPAPEDKSIVSTTENEAPDQSLMGIINRLQLPPPHANQQLEAHSEFSNCEPIIEVPATPEHIIEVPATPEPERTQITESDIEDTFCEDPDEIPTIKLNIEEFTQNLQNYMQCNMEFREGDMSKALVALTPEGASIPTPKLKNVSRLRTEHQVYELPDSHPLLEGLDKREPDDPCSYLLAIWTPGETADSIQPPGRCISQESDIQCDEKTCFTCNSIREANSQTVRGTLLIPCRTAMRGSFPLNGTYFQVNEVFADHESSLNPIAVPRAWIWNLPRRTVYFGTSIPTIFKGLSTEGIQYCFWRGFVCVRGFDQKTRSPRPLMARLHFPASKLIREKGKTSEN